jgi:hypothetical protein
MMRPKRRPTRSVIARSIFLGDLVNHLVDELNRFPEGTATRAQMAEPTEHIGCRGREYSSLLAII